MEIGRPVIMILVVRRARPIRPRAEQDIRVIKRVLAPIVVVGAIGIPAAVWQILQNVLRAKPNRAAIAEHKHAAPTGNGVRVAAKVLVRRVRQKILPPAVVVRNITSVTVAVLGTAVGPIAE